MLQNRGERERADHHYGNRFARCNTARGVGNTRRLIAGKKALQYLALLKPDTMDLDGVRAEMTEHILNLLKTK